VSKKNNIFSSKPKQIAHAATQVLMKVFGNVHDIKLIVISDMKLPINIADNFKNFGIKNYNVLAEPLEKFISTSAKNVFEFDKLLELLKDYDMVMIGYKSQSKFINTDFVKKILKKRKQKTIFFIDCGVPGNIEIDIGKISNCFLFDLNDLEQLYTSWIQNMTIHNNFNDDPYDIELKGMLDSFFNKLNFNLEQKMNFEKRLLELLKLHQSEIKLNLKNFLKKF
tara:strand:- start:74 stop:745 length:672 start_codon:yes stop_codon:yes gene_type:complete